MVDNETADRSDSRDDAVVRVVVVDDTADIRMFLRLVLSHGDRFRVVGEGANGREAVELAASLQPDLLVLDLQMPVMNGLDAIPLIREQAPRTEIVLYTSGARTDTEEAAIAAGALGLIDKGEVAGGLAGELARLLVNRWADPGTGMEVRVGPVASSAARVWIANTRRILASVIAHPGIIGGPLPDDVVAVFERFLTSWENVAAAADEFFWVGRADPAVVERLVTEWNRADFLTDEQLEELGVTWSPPEGRPFYEALTAGVLEALTQREETRRLAEALARQWPSTVGE